MSLLVDTITQVVLLHSFNCIEYPIVFVALNRLGAICSSSPPMLDAESLVIQLESAQVPSTLLLLTYGSHLS